MPDTLSDVQIDSDQRDYAQSLQEMERGLSIFGKIMGMTDDLKEVSKELPYNFRQPFNIVKAMFRLEPGLYTLHTGIEEDIQIGFRIDSPETDSDDVIATATGKTTQANTDNNFYRNRILRLEGELHDGDRKIRQQVDEIMNLKRELAEDKTATLLTHQKELSELREAHRNDIDRLKEHHRNDLKDLEKELGELEKIKFRMEMEQRAGGRDAGSRMLDMLEENAPMFFTVISGLFAQQPGSGQPQLTPEQAKALKASVTQSMQAQRSSPLPQEPLPNNEAEQSKGAEEETSRHLPANKNTTLKKTTTLGGMATLNGQFSTPPRNGHTEDAITL
ncbi:hypothetical protein [Fodinibius sp. AD559]|uniref:hypothetical protein n=1 Tax=Fodinibius sp. AD559 TaxID=3424179 RepID=UPI00404697C0